MKAPSGIWLSTWRMLSHPNTTWGLLMLLGVGAAAGIATGPQGHPALGVAMQLPALLLPFAITAWALTAHGHAAAPWSTGLLVALVGAALAGGTEAVVVVGGPAPAETATRVEGARLLPVHLGGQLTARGVAGAVELTLGVGTTTQAEATASADGRAVKLGPWWARVADIRPGDDATVARLSWRPRETPDAPPQRVALRVGGGTSVGDGARVSLRRIARDYGGSLGPAAELDVTWPQGRERAWVFVDHPGLDVHAGTSPWVFELVAVEGEPRLELGVRRGAPAYVAMAGWGLMALVLLVGVFLRRGEVRA